MIWFVAAVALVVEYVAFSVLFDAKELVPGAWQSLGAIAPMPIIVVVAFFILRSSANAEAASAPRPSAPRPRGVFAFLLGHVLAFGAFIAVSFHVRAQGDDAGIALVIAWVAIGVLALALLAAFVQRDAVIEIARHGVGPLALGAIVGVAAWSAGEYAKELWEPLARVTLRPVAAIVGMISPDLVVDVDARLVGTERFTVRVDAVCSGYEGMGLVAVLLCAYLWSFRRTLRFPHALALPLLAMGAAFLTNVLRIVSLIYVGTFGSVEVAIGGFHSKAGWLMFCGVALGTTWLARRARIFQREPAVIEGVEGAESAESGEGADDIDNPTAAYVVPLLALVGGALVTGLASDGGLDRLELVRLAAAGLALWLLRSRVHEALTGGGSWIGPLAGVVVFAMWMLLDDAPWNASWQLWTELGELPAWGLALWIFGRLVGSVIVVPLCEELAFRGFLLRRLVSVDFTTVAYGRVTPIAIVVSSVAFGALHASWLAGALAGVVYAGVTWRTGRLRDAIVAHAVTNALIAIVVLAAGRYSLWG